MTKPSLLDMCESVEKRVAELMCQFRERFQDTMFNADDPSACYFDVKGTTSGFCHFNYYTGKGYLRFNRQLMKENWEIYDQTIVHEVAHYCVGILYGQLRQRNGNRIIHGKEWKRMMQFFGVDPKRCHNYDVSASRAKRKMATYSYMCDCQVFELSQVRHNKILRGKKYVCNTCKDELIRV